MALLTFHGHATFSLRCDDGTNLCVDPFFAGNPVCDHDGGDVSADYVLLTHGHGDHVADAIPLVQRTGATVIAAHEIASYFEGLGHAVSGQHIGGGVQYPFGHVKMTPALHGGRVELPGAEGFTTVPGGFLIRLESGPRVYFAGDTGLTLDMQLLKGHVDVAILPIGDRYTMGPDDAVKAIEFIGPAVVVPCHYDTWPPIEQDGAAFADAVGDRARVELMTCGSTLEL